LIVLGIDPGYAIVGYGVIRYEAGRTVPLAYGAATTGAQTKFERRLQLIYDDICAIIAKWKPDAVAIEELFYRTNQKTVIGVAQARGVIVLAAQQGGIPVYEYTPLQVKVAVTGYGRAEKKQVMEMTRRLLGLKEIPRPDDAADALAIAISHANTAGTALRQKMMQQR